MPDYVGFFLNTPSKIVKLQTIHIFHPNFSRSYSIVRNAVRGFTGQLEDGSARFFAYRPFNVSQNTFIADLEAGVTVSLGDIGEEIAVEMDRLVATGGFATYPTVVYREYRSDDLSGPMLGPYIFQMKNVTFNGADSTFEATADDTNVHGTGRVYDITLYPLLRGFL